MRTEKATTRITFNTKPTNPLDKKVRVITWSLLTLFMILKVALIAGAVWLIVSLCSCSTAKSATQYTTAQSEVTATNTATAQQATADSLHRESVRELFRDRSLELTDVTIEYATPRKRTPKTTQSHNLTTQQPPATNRESPVTEPLGEGSRLRHISPAAHPAKLTIGKITAKENTAATQKAVTDSTAATQKAKSEQSASHDTRLTEQSAQRASPNTWGRAVLALAIILGLLIGYLYHRQKGVSHTA